MSKSRRVRKEEKLTIVKRCLSGEFGVCEAGRQMGVSQESILCWIHRYESEGEGGLTAAQGRRNYPRELKDAAVKDYLSGKGSLDSRAALAPSSGTSRPTNTLFRPSDSW